MLTRETLCFVAGRHCPHKWQALLSAPAPSGPRPSLSAEPIRLLALPAANSCLVARPYLTPPHGTVRLCWGSGGAPSPVHLSARQTRPRRALESLAADHADRPQLSVRTCLRPAALACRGRLRCQKANRASTIPGRLQESTPFFHSISTTTTTTASFKSRSLISRVILILRRERRER